MKIWAGSTRIDGQTLLVISSSFRKRRSCLVSFFLTFERTGGVIQQSGQHVVGLIFFGMFLNDGFQHLNRFVSLIRENEAGSEFLPRIGIVRFELEQTQVERN